MTLKPGDDVAEHWWQMFGTAARVATRAEGDVDVESAHRSSFLRADDFEEGFGAGDDGDDGGPDGEGVDSVEEAHVVLVELLACQDEAGRVLDLVEVFVWHDLEVGEFGRGVAEVEDLEGLSVTECELGDVVEDLSWKFGEE